MSVFSSESRPVMDHAAPKYKVSDGLQQGWEFCHVTHPAQASKPVLAVFCLLKQNHGRNLGGRQGRVALTSADNKGEVLSNSWQFCNVAASAKQRPRSHDQQPLRQPKQDEASSWFFIIQCKRRSTPPSMQAWTEQGWQDLLDFCGSHLLDGVGVLMHLSTHWSKVLINKHDSATYGTHENLVLEKLNWKEEFLPAP